jgi:hypothetical protein
MAEHAVTGNSKDLQRNKIPELELALEGRVTEHHRSLLRATLRSWTVLGDKQWTERHIALAHLAVRSFLSALKTSGAGFAMKNNDLSALPSALAARRRAKRAVMRWPRTPCVSHPQAQRERSEPRRRSLRSHQYKLGPVVLGPAARTPGTPNAKITRVSWHVTLIAAFSS